MTDYAEVMKIMRALAPALKAVGDDALIPWIMLAEEFVCPKLFGTSYNKALALYTMHLMFMDGAMKSEDESLSAYSQRVTSYSLSGEFSMSYGTATQNNTGKSIYDTPWGKIYDLLRKKKGGGFGLLTGNHGGC